jgi:hypothetical protein
MGLFMKHYPEKFVNTEHLQYIDSGLTDLVSPPSPTTPIPLIPRRTHTPVWKRSKPSSPSTDPTPGSHP